MHIKLIRVGYNAVHPIYCSHRNTLKSGTYLQKVLQVLRPQASILDLGCGAGEPIDDIFLRQGHSVTGLDISEEMIRKARMNCPGGDYRVRDIATLGQNEFLADAVICMYAMFHLPRGTHGKMLRTINSCLPKGGLLLISMGDKPFEGFTDFYGVQMWWSQWGPTKNRELLASAGFNILIDEIDRSGGESHQVILARKK